MTPSMSPDGTGRDPEGGVAAGEPLKRMPQVGARVVLLYGDPNLPKTHLAFDRVGTVTGFDATPGSSGMVLVRWDGRRLPPFRIHFTKLAEVLRW